MLARVVGKARRDGVDVAKDWVVVVPLVAYQRISAVDAVRMAHTAREEQVSLVGRGRRGVAVRGVGGSCRRRNAAVGTIWEEAQKNVSGSRFY